jgi:hypothetical protein
MDFINHEEFLLNMGHKDVNSQNTKGNKYFEPLC